MKKFKPEEIEVANMFGNKPEDVYAETEPMEPTLEEDMTAELPEEKTEIDSLIEQLKGLKGKDKDEQKKIDEAVLALEEAKNAIKKAKDLIDTIKPAEVTAEKPEKAPAETTPATPAETPAVPA